MINTKIYAIFLLMLPFILIPFTVNGQGIYSVFENSAEFSLSNADLIREFDGRLLYYAKEGDNNKLWVSNGTPEGTFKISAEDQTEIGIIKSFDDVIYFKEKKGDTFYISKLILGSNELNTIYTSEEAFKKILFWQENFYFITDSEASFFGDDLTKFNPISGTTLLLFTSDFGGMRGLGSTDNSVYFVVNLDEGNMLGKTDGTLANTSTFYQFEDTSNGLHVVMRTAGDKIFFFYKTGSNPYQLWVSDGTSLGTQVLNEYKSDSFLNQPKGAYVFFDGKIFFVMRKLGAPSGTTYDLHVSDGTVEGTINLNDGNSDYLHPRRLTVFNNKVYFSSLQSNWGLKATDGTISGTETIISPYGYQSGSIGGAFDFGVYNDNLIIKAYNNDFGGEMYISDGTLDGTTLLADIEPGEESSSPNDFTQVGDLFFFTAELNDIRQLWVYDPNLITCASFEITNSSVENATNTVLGIINVAVTGGQEPYSYQIDDGTPTSTSEFTLSVGEYILTITDNVGCSIEFPFVIDLDVAVLNKELLQSFKIFPNPLTSTSALHIELELPNISKNVLLLGHDIAGKVVYKKEAQTTGNILKNEIPAHTFTAGSYTFTIIIDGKIAAIEKLIIH